MNLIFVKKVVFPEFSVPRSKILKLYFFKDLAMLDVGIALYATIGLLAISSLIWKDSCGISMMRGPLVHLD